MVVSAAKVRFSVSCLVNQLLFRTAIPATGVWVLHSGNENDVERCKQHAQSNMSMAFEIKEQLLTKATSIKENTSGLQCAPVSTTTETICSDRQRLRVLSALEEEAQCAICLLQFSYPPFRSSKRSFRIIFPHAGLLKLLGPFPCGPCMAVFQVLAKVICTIKRFTVTFLDLVHVPKMFEPRSLVSLIGHTSNCSRLRTMEIDTAIKTGVGLSRRTQ